jgi:hypothetical protein
MMVCRLAQPGRHVDADVGVMIVVINAASSSHPDPVRAWVRGLSKRQRDTGKECFFIQVLLNLRFLEGISNTKLCNK